MRTRRFITVALLALTLALSFAAAAAAVDGRLTLVSLNDVHGRIYPEKEAGGLAKAFTVAEGIRAKDPGNFFFVHAGDINEGPMFFYFHGKPEMTGFNAMGLSVGTIGNHEFDLGKDVFFEALGYAEFPVVVSNLRLKDGTPAPLPEYFVKTAENGMKVAFFGLVTPALAFVTKGSEDFRPGQDLPAEAERMLSILKDEKPDAVILLSHCGLDADREIASSVAGIHAIIGGHSHTLMEEGELVEGPGGWKTLIGQAGSYARHLGVMELAVKDGAVSPESTWRVQELDASVAEDEHIAALIEPFRKELEERFSEPIADQPVDMDARKGAIRCQETNLGNLVADAFRWKAGSQVAIVNGGGIRGDQVYPAGKISYAEINKMMPFGNTLYVGKVTGDELLQVMETSASALIGEGDEYDESLRTPTGGFMQVSGIRVEIDARKKPRLIDNNGVLREDGDRVVKLEVLGADGQWEAVDPAKEYTLATSDWTAGGGDKYVVLKNGSFVSLEQFIMESTAEYIRHLGEMRAEVEGRITIIR